MPRKREYTVYVADFETTVYEEQTMTEVWASAIVQLWHNDVLVLHSIDDTFDYLESAGKNLIVYYHNLKFDGSFWIDYLLNVRHMKQAFIGIAARDDAGYFVKDNDMPLNSFKYSISDKGMWYTVKIRTKDNYFIEMRDSYKLLPFSVKRISKSFGTEHKKLEMEYEGVRYAGCEITPQEQEYIKNDVLVVKEAIEIMYSRGHDKLTIGACCMGEFKGFYGKKAFEAFFPDLRAVWLQSKSHGVNNALDWVRRSYRGGWTYLKRGKEKRIIHNGCTADVNSLYPSQMHSDGGRIYPVGFPKFWTGKDIPAEAQDGKHYYFIRIKTAFKLKEGYLPFIQIKGNLLYKANEMLRTSKPFDRFSGKYLDSVFVDGKVESPYRPVLTLTMTDYQLMLEHYDLINPVILDGCYFEAMSGLFDEYIEKYRALKMNAKTEAERTLAKLYLNNLYGKFATSTDSTFKKAYIKDDKSVGFYTIEEDNKKPGYIPIGTAITSYARDFTIRAAQKNYKHFIYADTDSIHCSCTAADLVGVPQHPTAFNHWKVESSWDYGYFVRSKMYVEHVIKEDEEPVKPFYNLKGGGMTPSTKDNVLMSITRKVYKDGKELAYRDAINHLKKLPKEDLEFIRRKRTWAEFREGLEIPGKLMARRIRGGTVLLRTSYIIRKG